MEASRIVHALDLQLARDAGAGNLDAWHEVVQRYSGVVYSMVRRYLADFGEETWRDTYVDVLEYLYATGLPKYDGRSALSTWIMTIARTRALDQRRMLCGRKREPSWLAKCSTREKFIYHLYYEEGEGLGSIRRHLGRQGTSIGVEEIAEILLKLERRMDRRLRSRLAYDLHARSIGAVSSNLFALVEHLRSERRIAAESLRPDVILLEERTQQLMELVVESMQKLDEDERRIVELWFYRSLSAQEIAVEMGLEGPRRAYTLVQRSVDHLRRLLGGNLATPTAVPLNPKSGREA